MKNRPSSTLNSAPPKGHRSEAVIYGSVNSKAAAVEASPQYAFTPEMVAEPDWKRYCDCRLKSFESGR